MRVRRRQRVGDQTTVTVKDAGPPWILAAVAPFVGLVLCAVVRFGYGDNRETAGMVVGIVAFGIGAVVAKLAAGRDRFVVQLLTATCGVAGVACYALITFGFTRTTVITYVLALWAVGAVWVVRAFPSVHGYGVDVRDGQKILDALGLGPIRVTDVRHDPTRTTSRWTMTGGKDAEDLQGMARTIRALSRAVFVRVVPDRRDPTSATVTVVREDVLEHPVPWSGPSAPGQSVARPLRIGRREDGTDELLTLPGRTGGPDGPPRSPWLGVVSGVPGSGKTRFAWAVWIELATRSDVVVWLSDVAKGAQTASQAPGLFDWVATDQETANALLEAVQGVSRHRAEWLGAHGHEQWAEGCGIPLLVVWIEEAAQSDAAMMKRIVGLAETVRSTGIVLAVSLQRPSASRLSTDARYSLTGAACFGMGDERTVAMALSPQTVAAGANPHTWGSSFPGLHYLEAPGVPDGDWSMPCRTFDVDGPTLARTVRDWSDGRTGLDEGSASAAGPVYGSRYVPEGTPRVDVVGVDNIPQQPAPRRELEPVVSDDQDDDPGPRALTPDQRDDVIGHMLEGVLAGGLEVRVTAADLLRLWQGNGLGGRRDLYRWIDGDQTAVKRADRGVYTVSRPLHR